MVDAGDLKSPSRKGVLVRVQPSAILENQQFAAVWSDARKRAEGTDIASIVIVLDGKRTLSSAAARRTNPL